MRLARPAFVEPLRYGVGVLALLALVPLFVWEVSPARFPSGAHDLLAATPLALIAVAVLLHPIGRSSLRAWARAMVLGAAFLLWSANQLWPAVRLATPCNDAAIALFLLDVFLGIRGGPG